ncbi:MAG TPA: outer membrane protein assembly factor BamD [Steroidobacteraceae bacterium]|nr:outer membrane protein assembly factor BamD [Steroidobacteraceae bacterium]
MRPERHPLRLLPAFCAALLLALAGCGSNPERELQSNPERIYEMANRSLQNSNYGNAIRLYEQLEARFPFSASAKQAQIDLMYAYYKNREPEAAIDQADQFIRENPTHPRVDYAHYIKGLVYFERNPNFLERLFNTDLSERPPIDARRSFQSFSTLVQQYPNSEYAADARQRMIFLRNRLADYEVHVANYYYKRGAYVGAINRAKYAIVNYDGAPAVREALGIIEKSYTALDMPQLAADTRAVLEANYSADEVKEATAESWWKFW